MSNEEQRRKAEQRQGYPGYRPSRLLHQDGKLGGEPEDAIDYTSDDLQELWVAKAMEADWTPLGDARDGAHAEQIDAAMREAERWDCTRTDDYFGLKQVPAVRAKLRDVLADMRSDWEAVEWVDPYVPVLVGANDDAWWVSPLYWDPDDPGSYRGVFGVVAESPRRVHVLRAGYTPAVWLAEERDRRHDCAWDGPACLGYTRTLLTFSGGQYIVAMPACHFCEGWLLDGAPV
jgi:hypothetical protein